MSDTADISPAIVEALYREALVLADEARASLTLSGRIDSLGKSEDLARVALSCEAMRTTTRMMHAIAWLLNQRAFLAGELSEFQLRRHGRLPPPLPSSDPANLALLDEELYDIVVQTEMFYARVARLDHDWHNRFAMQPAAIHRLRERLGQDVAAL
jgi:regulator of CtrA degradation